MVICLERGADLYIAQLMPLPLTVSCSVKSRLVLPFWYRPTRVVSEKGPLNGCVCVCVCVCDDGNSDVIEQITEEKDLSVYITADLKPSTQCVRAAAKARSVMGMVRRNFTRLDKEDFLVDIQNVLPASYGVLCPGMVTILKERHRVLRKGSKISNKDGAWTYVTCLMSRDCGTWS